MFEFLAKSYMWIVIVGTTIGWLGLWLGGRADKKRWEQERREGEIKRKKHKEALLTDPALKHRDAVEELLRNAARSHNKQQSALDNFSFFEDYKKELRLHKSKELQLKLKEMIGEVEKHRTDFNFEKEISSVGENIDADQNLIGAMKDILKKELTEAIGVALARESKIKAALDGYKLRHLNNAQFLSEKFNRRRNMIDLFWGEYAYLEIPATTSFVAKEDRSFPVVVKSTKWECLSSSQWNYVTAGGASIDEAVVMLAKKMAALRRKKNLRRYDPLNHPDAI